MENKTIHALEAFKKGRNIFLTGGAGTGKSFTLGELVEHAEKNDIKIARTAMTGMASLQIPRGQTLHSALRIGIKNKKEQAEEIYASGKFQS